jgi:trehalose-6-phosphate synthase
MRSLRKRVAENDVAKWSDSFLTTLRQARRSRAAWGGSGLPGDVEWTVERPPSR